MTREPDQLPWVNSVPSSWEVVKLRHLCRSHGGGTPSKDEPRFWGGPIPWVSPKDMKRAVIVDTEDRITSLGLQSSSSKLAMKGALLIVVRSGILRHTIPTAIAGVDVALNQDMKAVSGGTRLLASYLKYFIDGHQNDLLTLWRKQGATVESIDSELMADTFVPVPPLGTQRAIAAFLDGKTAAIDALIQKKEKLIELLDEKRAALINQAVTKGLDPKVRMKDSGIPWIGEIPAQWEVLPFRRLGTIRNGQVDPRVEPFIAMPLFAPNHVESGTGRLLAIETAREQGADSGKYEVKEGEIVYSKIRPELRKVFLAPLDGLCSADMYPIRPNQRVTASFLLWAMLSDGFNESARLASERVAMPKVNRETLAEFPICVPTISEQREIVTHIKTAVSGIDTTRAKILQQLEKVREFRQSVITAAVSGQTEIES